MAEPSSPPPVTAALGSSQQLPRPEEPDPTVKQKQQPKLAITTSPPTETPPPQQQQPKQADFISYITDLRNLSPALSAFHRRYDELHEHLDFIKTSIDSRLLQLLDTEVVVSTVNESCKSDKQTTGNDHSQSSQLFPDREIVPTVDELGKPEQTKDTNSAQSSLSEIESLCKNMSFGNLRKYIISNLSNLSKLREEVPLALKLAFNPAKLVLDCFGRFFLQGIKAYCKDSPMIPSRQASILSLEYFLLMGFDSDEIEARAKQEAESSAMIWRNRLISEGGLVKACEIDARGLLLLIGCFGIPKVFKNEDIRDLIWAGNVIEISDALRRSNVLLARIPDIIEWLLKNKMEVEAVGIIYTFGLEGRFLPGKILKSFFYDSKQAWKLTKNASEGSLSTVNKANKSQLAEMKRVRKCLKDHKQDPSKVLHGFQLDEKIFKLETRISDLDTKIKEQVKPKREESEEPDYSNNAKRRDIKRARFADSRPHVDYIEKNLLDGGVPQFSTAYSTYSSVAGPASGIRAADMVHGQINNTNGVQPYGWRGEASLNERLVNHSYVEPSALGSTGLYRVAPPAVEGFAGLLNPSPVGVSYRSSASDLYQFADTIVERETCGGSRMGASAAIPPGIASANPSAYYY